MHIKNKKRTKNSTTCTKLKYWLIKKSLKKKTILAASQNSDTGLVQKKNKGKQY